MKHVWTWGGKYFGYIENNCLCSNDGKQVGQLTNDEIYDRNGKYIGEIMNDNRLIYCRSKSSWRGYSFTPSLFGSVGRYADYAGYAMYAGYEDFKYPR